MDVLAAALSVPGVTEPPLVAFRADGFWRGEAHRLADRPAALSRLIEEAAAAGAEQVIVVSAAPGRRGPHELSAGPARPRGRIGEQLAAESRPPRCGTRCAPPHAAFHGVFVIRPAHNALRPFDLAGAYDERSDRRQSLAELCSAATRTRIACSSSRRSAPPATKWRRRDRARRHRTTHLSAATTAIHSGERRHAARRR